MCATGCGMATQGTTLCVGCHGLWEASPEYRRSQLARVPSAAYVAAFDFCTRIRAERLNGGKS